jgi:hypothetical protein
MSGKGLASISAALIALSAAVLGVTATQANVSAPEPYSPGLGDFMTAYVQPHHTKLWFAGASGDWDLAAYEANELDETFDDVKTYQATWRNVPVAKLVNAVLEPSLRQVKIAIAAKNIPAFKAAYGDLTAACNACHTTAGHGFIRIVVPAANPYADQSLTGH